MIRALILAFNQVFSKPFRTVFWKALGLTFLLLIALWAGLQSAIATFLIVPYPWLDTAIAWIAGAGLIIALGFFISPVTSLFAGIFLDEIAERVEAHHYPQDPPGKAMPFTKSLGLTIKFFLLIVAVNIIAVMLVLFVGLGIAIFFVANGYLLGREYFEMIAMRFLPPEEALALRRHHAMTIFLAGLVIAGFLAIPIVNLLTPLFATAFMVHIYKMVSGSARPE